MKNEANHMPFSINIDGNWGNLIHPQKHDAAIGIRFCDNRMRELQGFPDRRTIMGDRDVVLALDKWLSSKKTMRAIKSNTRFSRGLDDWNEWTTTAVIGKNCDIDVILEVTCSGEYCYVRAYADKIPSGALRVDPLRDGSGFVASVGDRDACCMIHAKSRKEAMGILIDYVANELEACGTIGDPDEG